MMSELLGWAGNALLILLLLTFVWLVVRFFSDSVGSGKCEDEPKRASRLELVAAVIVSLVASGYFAHRLIEYLNNDDPNWIMVSLFGVSLVLTSLQGLLFTWSAARRNTAVDIQQ